MEAASDALRIQTADRADAPEILAVCHAAFASEAERYDDWSLPPLHETVVDLEAAFATHLILKAVEASLIVGSVRGELRQGTCHIARLVVDPAHQGRGIGEALARAIENRFPDATRFEIFTGHRSTAALRLYDKLGYRRFREESLHERLTLVYLAKEA